MAEVKNHEISQEHKPKVFKRGEVKLLIGDSVEKSNGEGKKGF